MPDATASTTSAVVRDPHHDGASSWRWQDGRLYHQAVGSSRWVEVKRLHPTPARIAALAAALPSPQPSTTGNVAPSAPPAPAQADALPAAVPVLVEPSDDEQAAWPDATREYVRGLEEALAADEELMRAIDAACLEVARDNTREAVGEPDPGVGRYLLLNENGDPLIDTDDSAEVVRGLYRLWGRVSDKLDAAEARVRELEAALTAAERAVVVLVDTPPRYWNYAGTRAVVEGARQRHHADVLAGFRTWDAACQVGEAAKPERKPQEWESLSEEDRLRWAPRGPYSFVLDGDDEEAFLSVVGDGAPAVSLTFDRGEQGALDASRYVAWLNREHAARQAGEVG